MSAKFAKLICLLASMVLGPIIWVHAFDLTVHSWHWLVWGYLGQLALLAAGDGWDRRDE